MSQTSIHETAIIAKGAEFGNGVKIGPYSVIGPKVKLADNVTLDSHVRLEGRTTIGQNTKIYSFATVGTDPQDLKFKGEDSELIIGSDNIIREYVNINKGTEQGGGKTLIGNRNLIMVYTHIAHDCIIANDCILVNAVNLAGHVEVDDFAVIGGMSAVHQFVKIGSLAMIGGGSMVAQDVPPYVMVQGDRARAIGLNLTGIKRKNMSAESISNLKKIFSIIMSENITLTDSIAKIQNELNDSPEKNSMLSFLARSNRGICRNN